jgi:NAD(P)-dependent dehydrogenase (short-subunit alcohol dehydrogenase family)
MKIKDARVVITGATREMGRTLAICFAKQGAEVFLSGRNMESAERTKRELVNRGYTRVHSYHCDLSDASSIAAFANSVGQVSDSIDILVNNGAAWLETATLEEASDDEIVNTITSGAAGMILMVKHFLPLLRKSPLPDIINMVSSSALSNNLSCEGHEAFYASKGGQGRAAQILSHRLRDEGIRVISLYPHKFENIDPFDERWLNHKRTSNDQLTAQSIIDCVFFAISQPRDCFIRAFEFESL